MSVQQQKQEGRGGRRRAPPKANNGRIASAADVNVVRMAAAIAEGRAAERGASVATAAYFRAQKRGFEPGHELEDWLAAEAEVAADMKVSSSMQVTGSGSVS